MSDFGEMEKLFMVGSEAIHSELQEMDCGSVNKNPNRSKDFFREEKKYSCVARFEL